jgi:hypothetical protein
MALYRDGKRLMKYYALKHKKYGLLGISVSSNGDDAEFCNPSTVTLDWGNDEIWLTKDKNAVEKVLDGEGVPWYNSDISRPELGSLKSKDIEIVEVEI